MASQTIEAHIGDKIRVRRTELGLTQEQLADALGVSYQQVQKYESGANRISAEGLWRLAQRLEVQISFFFEGVGLEAGAEGEPRLAKDGRARGALELVRSFGVIADPLIRAALTSLTKAVAERGR